MQIKLFEVRDEGTFIPAIAIKINEPANDAERFLMRRCGFPIPNDQQTEFSILFGRMQGGMFSADVYEWAGRTMPVAHKYIEDNWDSLTTGDVVCVETILGLRETPKISERLS